MEKFWLKSYPKGVPENIEVGTETLADLMENVCSKYPNNRAITCHKETITFAQTRRYVNNLSTSLVELGVFKGDRVAIIMPNIMQYPLSIFAILNVGAVVVNINPLYTEDEIGYLLQDSGATTVIVLDIIAKKLNFLYYKYNVKNVIVTSISDLYSSFKRFLMPLALKYLKRTDTSYNYPSISFRQATINNREFVPKDKVINTDLAFLQYTGATTGRPKGAMLSHKNIVANIKQINAWLSGSVANLDKQVAIDALPLYHIFSLTANLFTFFFFGSENVMIPNPKDVKSMLKTLRQNKFTVFTALDTLYNHLLNSQEFTRSKYPYFKYSVAGGMPARKSVAENWYKVTNVIPSNCYGLTETSPAVTMSIIGSEFDGGVGYPVSSTELEIRDITTYAVVKQGETGVVWVRGPQVMEGYWNNSEQTAKAFDAQGWFCTNDIGYLNENGKLFIVGRQNDMIIVSGFNVYPVEVENVLDKILEILESAVIGIKNNSTGEGVVAFVVFKEGMSLTQKDIIDKCRISLASYKIPNQIIDVESIPKTLVGKIDKIALAKQYESFNLKSR